MEPTSAESETQQPRETAEALDTGCLTGWEWITPEVVTKFSCATDEFLCPASANTYGIDFLGFTVVLSCPVTRYAIALGLGLLASTYWRLELVLRSLVL
ncbi:hypothetical protein FOZ62_020832 [Perkinsus olseni]|uniref:Uncharacterized protein n=1 Tax=Perkinsus olseni TaxID=32597 RepID=A0A7J6T6T6_PEROL|nr:hypothetical protein FOZ62_020832 [Perkinsus olseni]